MLLLIHNWFIVTSNICRESVFWFLFCYTVLYIFLVLKEERADFFYFNCALAVMWLLVLCVFLTVSWVYLWSVVGAFLIHTHLLFHGRAKPQVRSFNRHDQSMLLT